MPEEVTLQLRIPPELGNQDEIVREVRARVQAIEEDQAQRRARTGRRVVGRYAILRQSWRESPTSREPRRNLRPTFAARSLWARLEAIQREFTAAYRTARLQMLAGIPTTFPYWLRRFAAVAIAAAEASN